MYIGKCYFINMHIKCSKHRQDNLNYFYLTLSNNHGKFITHCSYANGD